MSLAARRPGFSAAKAAYDAQVAALDNTDLETLKTGLLAAKDIEEGKIETAEGDRADKKTELDGTIKTIKEQETLCSFFVTHISKSLENRATEIRGLEEAKRIIENAQLQR